MKSGIKMTLLKALNKVVEKEVKANFEVWRPPCIGFLYQPKRPKRKKL